MMLLLQRPGNLRRMGNFAGTGIKDRGLGVLGKGVFAPPPGPPGIASQNPQLRSIQNQADRLQGRVGSLINRGQVQAAQSQTASLLRRLERLQVGPNDISAKEDALEFVRNIQDQLNILAKAPEQSIAPAAAAAASAAAPAGPQPAKAVLQADQAAAVRELARMVPKTTAEAQVEVTGAGGRTRKELLTSPGQVKFTRSSVKPGAGKVATHFEKLMKDVPADFDESKYLANNPDVAKAVKQGAMPSGLWHYVRYGKKEGRSFSGWFGEFGGFLGGNTLLLLAAAAGAYWYCCKKGK